MNELVAINPTDRSSVAFTMGPDALALIGDSMRPASRRAYAADLAAIAKWARARGLVAGDVGTPAQVVLAVTANPGTIADYLADTSCYGDPDASTLKPSTLGRRLAAIAKIHRIAAATTGAPDPMPTKYPTVLMALQGAKNRWDSYCSEHRGTPRERQARPLHYEDLSAILDGIDLDDLRGIRDAALLALGWHGGFRRSELVGLDLADLKPDPKGLVVTLAMTKTTKDGKPELKAIDGRTVEDGPGWCPVELVKRWIDRAGITEGALFRQVTRQGHLGAGRLCAQTVGRVLVGRAQAVGLSAGYSAHSLRAGVVTEAFRHGASEAEVRQITGHKSAVVWAYRREADPFAGKYRTVRPG